MCADPNKRSFAPAGTCLKKTSSCASESSVTTRIGLASNGASSRGFAVWRAVVIQLSYSPEQVPHGMQ